MEFPTDKKIPSWSDEYLKIVWLRAKKMGIQDKDYIDAIKAEMVKRKFEL